ncbi:MAG: stage 0 sporulation family protein [Oscillospiraceae bacterium]|nr:stage 0 sporulation family protein [Oscillospiraceae bacterium]
MAEVIGVRFKQVGKVYYFDPDGIEVQKTDSVIVETARGIECGEVAMENRQVGDESIVKPLKKVIRKATGEDLAQVRKNQEKEAAAAKICNEKIAAHKLDMKLVDVEYTFDNNKILFYFTADGRVDFRELVKDLASVFRTRIELRQIGVRDEAKMLGGLGICGRPFCCATFLGEFQPVSIKMAKEQSLSLNPVKISGTCGRLMCCLKYEQEAYEDLLRTTPKVGALVGTADGKGKVVEVNLLSGLLKVRLDANPDAPARIYPKEEVRLLRDGKIKVDKKEMEAFKEMADIQ